jgi:hypothetical protein
VSDELTHQSTPEGSPLVKAVYWLQRAAAALDEAAGQLDDADAVTWANEASERRITVDGLRRRVSEEAANDG